jgi:hypothetical protein
MTNDVLIKEVQGVEFEDQLYVIFYREGCLSDPLFITTKFHAEKLAKEILGEGEETVDIVALLLSQADQFVFKAMVETVDSLEEVENPEEHEVRMVEEVWEPYIYTKDHGWETAVDHIEREREESMASDLEQEEE